MIEKNANNELGLIAEESSIPEIDESKVGAKNHKNFSKKNSKIFNSKKNLIIFNSKKLDTGKFGDIRAFNLSPSFGPFSTGLPSRGIKPV